MSPRNAAGSLARDWAGSGRGSIELFPGYHDEAGRSLDQFADRTSGDRLAEGPVGMGPDHDCGGVVVPSQSDESRPDGRIVGYGQRLAVEV